MASLDPQKIEDARRTLRAHYNKTYQINPYPEEWRNLSELPSKEEIMPKTEAQRISEAAPYRSAPEPWDNYQRDPVYDPKLPVNVVDGPWDSKMAYVGAHYELLREDAVAALRRSVGEVQARPDMFDDNDTCIYTHVTFVGLQLCRIGAAFRVAFSTERAGKQIRWKQSKRLLQGTLVALSPHRDKFRSVCKLAVIAARPFENGLDQNPPTVDLFWADPNEAVFDPVEPYLMVEAREGYFEASRHMLVALQKLMCEKSDLMKYVAFLDKDMRAPRYLEQQPFMDLTALEHKPEIESTAPVDEETERLFNVDVLNRFPQYLRSSMDDSQMRACRDMLTKSVAIVQGPPGTGKTFTSVAALKVLIGNLGPGDPPIIISAQTNHALDQLLNHVMAFDERIVRLGGRADKENKKILERTLYELRMANSDVPNGKQGLRRCLKDFEDNVGLIRNALGSVLKNEVLTAEALLENKIITQQQRDSLFDAQWDEEEDSLGLIADWVGDQLMAIPGAPQINLGLPLEEEDIAYEQAQNFAMELDGDENNDGDFTSQDNESFEHLGGEWVPFLRKFTGKHNGLAAEANAKILLKKHKDLNEIQKAHRGDVYRYWEKRMNSIALQELRSRLRVYQNMVEEYQVTRGISNLRLIHHLGIKVIGCTTTGLAKYRGFISAVRPRTLLIEEAAETLEGTIMGGMVESLEQLILVGDHQQLQAKCTVRALEDAPYHLKVSMFERLIDNGLPYVMLNKQRRMISDVRKLLCIEPDPFYKDLHDHESVLDRVHTRPPVPGMGGRDTYFFHHSWPEARSSDCSRFNPDEAEMMAGFFHYLVYNGVDPAKITVLTFYNGQRRQLIKELNKKTDLYGKRPYFNVFTVDSYQGEENDIILLSLVRSNSYLSVGFLDNKNRLVVALSRARRGLYIFGNTITLTMAETTEDKYGREALWDPLINFMKSQGRYCLEGGFPITCLKHGNTVRIIDPISWFMNTGGCEEPCTDGCLPCGHPCNLTCHPFDHARVICKEPCDRILSCGHGCANLCNAKPCHCVSCAMPEGADGRQIFDVSDVVTADDVLMHRMLYRDEDHELETSSPHSGILKSKTFSRAQRQQFIFTEAARRGHPPSRKRDGRSLGTGPSDLTVSPRYQTENGRNTDVRTFKDSQNKHRVAATPTRALMSINRLAPPNNTASGPIFEYSFAPEGSTDRNNNFTAISKGSHTGNTKLPRTSNLQAWRSWDAKKADDEMEERRRLEDVLNPAVNRSKLIFNETYLPITIENGHRHRTASGAKKSIIPRASAAMDHVSISHPADSSINGVGKCIIGLKNHTLRDRDGLANLIDLDEELGAMKNSVLLEESSVSTYGQQWDSPLEDLQGAPRGRDVLSFSLLDREDLIFDVGTNYSKARQFDEKAQNSTEHQKEVKSGTPMKELEPGLRQQHNPNITPLTTPLSLLSLHLNADDKDVSTTSTALLNTSELIGFYREGSGSPKLSTVPVVSPEQHFGRELVRVLNEDEFGEERKQLHQTNTFFDLL